MPFASNDDAIPALPCCVRLARPQRRGAGFALVEVILASVVLGLGITTAIVTLQRGFRALDTARNKTYVAQVMQS